MAYYAALVPLVQLLNDITHHERYPNFLLDKQHIATLYEKFNLLQKSFDDFSPKNHQEKSVDVLQRRIRNAAYKVQDIIESHLSTTFSTQIHGKNKILGFKNLVSASVPLHNTLGKEYQELERVKEEIDSILGEIMRIKESHSAHGRNTMVGFEEQQTKIKDQLCGESSKREVISIAGIGGIGKTTLAANIFDDKLVYDRFDCRAWVSISQYYHIPKVLQDIADSMNTNTGLSGSCEGVLADRIYKYLVGRRYLIIIDDIWDIKVWDGIKRIFPDNSNASRIMITTRLSDVANYIARCAFVHQMQFLNEDQSWNVLQQKVFAQEHCPEELEVIGKLIAKNCRGLPLTIVGIAGVLLNVNKARNDWVEIARNVSSAAIHKNDEHVSKILSLSYNHLPHHLKPCFLYLGGFLGHKTIEVSKLIRLWVAEGFLKPTESKSMEEVGEEYFKDLVNRNLVLVTKKTSNGKFRYCSTHEVMRDLCSQIAHCENLLLCVQERHDFHPKPIGNARRLFFPTPAAYFSFRKYITEHASHVRSVIINANYQDDDQCLLVASGCKLLRILDGTTISHPSIPNAIFELLHIRYLALKVSGDIHPFIFRLSNLQTLILNGVISLPPAIWKMPQLRHVIAREASLSLFPYVCRFVSSLKTSKRIGNFRFTSDSIKMIPNLKTLKVVYRDDERYKYWEEFGLNNLFHLHQLEKLGICFDDQQRGIATPLPENFVCPSTLIKLTLSAVELPWEDMTIVGSLPNLQVLKLRSGAFVGDEWNTIEGEFPKLKFLLLQGLDLKFWGAENTHFPRLEQLHIRYCKKLEEIPHGIGDIPTLQLIWSIWSTPGADSSALRIQEEQRDQGNDDLQVHVISGIDRLR